MPGGGLSPQGERWIEARPNFFLPVKVLSQVFRGKFLDYLGRAYRDGELCLTRSLAPMAGPEQVLKYLARYTHRIAIANSRLVCVKDGQVRFRYKDYAKAGKQRVMTLGAVEFLRRFLMRVLPRGFVRIRHYGLLANRYRRSNVTRCRKLACDTKSAP